MTGLSPDRDIGGDSIGYFSDGWEQQTLDKGQLEGVYLAHGLRGYRLLWRGKYTSGRECDVVGHTASMVKKQGR